MDALDLFEGIAACRNKCSSVTIDDQSNVPRGFFTLAQPGDSVDIMLVAQNPGQPMDREHKIYHGLDPRSKATRHLEFARECFLQRSGKKFHERISQWMSELYGLPVDRVYRRVVYTNVVKCTTEKNAIPPKSVVNACMSLHLRREILIWRPKVVVALGNIAAAFLKRANIKHTMLPHPSHRRGNNYHRGALKQLRTLLKVPKCHAT